MANLAANLAIAVVGQLLYAAFAPKPDDIEGPRLDDLNVPAVNPGNPINRIWGTMKVPGQLIWTTGLEETKHSKDVKGGKGGGKKQQEITYTYSASMAVAVCEGTADIIRIYGGEKLIWVIPSEDALVDYDAALAAYTAERTTYWTDYYTQLPPWTDILSDGSPRFLPTQIQNMIDKKVAQDVEVWKKENDQSIERPEFDSVTVYRGTETQMPDATMESVLGVGEVPAYRGITYFVIQNLQLADFGNTIPTFRVEVRDRQGNVSVKEIIIDLCTDAGLVEGDTFEVDPDLSIMEIQGFALTRLSSARSAIELLTNVFPIDAVEAGDRITFRGRDRLPVAAIDWNDLRAHSTGNDPGSKLERTRVDDLQLPREIKLSYQDRNRDFSKNSVFASRQFSQSNMVETKDIPVSADPTVMKKAAETALAQVISQRNGYACKVPAKYLRLRPGDVVLLPVTPTDYKVARITQMDIGKNMVLDLKLTDHVLSEADIKARADTSIIPGVPVVPFADTVAYVMDVPSLDDTQLGSGAFVAFAPTTANWAGAALYRDRNSGSDVPLFGASAGGTAGTEWALEVTGTEPADAGFAVGVLPDASPFLLDRTNTLTVFFETPNPTFVSQTFDQMVNGTENVFLVGNEIIQAQDVNYLSDNVVEFSNLLRGQRGTEWAVYSHLDREPVVHLTAVTTERWELPDTLIDKDVDYRTVTQGKDVLAQNTETFRFINAAHMALAPAILQATRNGNNDLTVELDPRARFAGLWTNGAAPNPTELDPEEFVVEVYDAPAHGAANLIRQSTLVGSRVFSYTAADQIADFGSVQNPIHLKIFQKGVDARLGFPRYATV